MTPADLARWVLIACWVFFISIGLARHLSLTRERRQRGLDKARRQTDRRSDLGMLLEALGFAMLIPFRFREGESADAWREYAAIAIAPAAIVFYWLALRELGKDFRIRAVVTEDHHLVTTGPYSVLRHPIYFSVLLGLVAIGLHAARWEGLALALLVFLMGTELRVSAEDSLLERQFGSAFHTYRTRVRAYLPFIR